MIHLAVWLKRNDFKVDQVQNFYPTPMSGASAMYYTGFNPYRPITGSTEPDVFVAKGDVARRRQKAILRYHDPLNFETVREALIELNMPECIGRGPNALVPPFDPLTEGRPSVRTGGKRVGGARDGGRTSSGQKRAHGDRPKNADFGGRKGASAGRGSNRSGSRTGGAASSFNGRPSGRGGNGRPQGKTVS
ncbi:MAG: DUF3362 domain-containing protein, partial [Ruminobacter sp.]|nr:DUF3362 domain-containing protein [Ruminobacter sp.]